MKLNGREQMAVESLKKILERIEQGEPILLLAKQTNAIKDVFGIDLKATTRRKGHIETFVRGKQSFHIEFMKPFSAWSAENRIISYGFFPFQIKELKAKQ